MNGQDHPKKTGSAGQLYAQERLGVSTEKRDLARSLNVSAGAFDGVLDGGPVEIKLQTQLDGKRFYTQSTSTYAAMYAAIRAGLPAQWLLISAPGYDAQRQTLCEWEDGGGEVSILLVEHGHYIAMTEPWTKHTVDHVSGRVWEGLTSRAIA